MRTKATSSILLISTVALALSAAPGCGPLAESGKSGNPSRLDLNLRLEDVSSGGCLNIEKVVSRLNSFPETVLMKEFTKDFRITGSSPGRNLELYLAKASFMFRYLQATEFSAEFIDFRQSGCESVTEIKPFIAPEITPQDDPNSDPEEAGGGSDPIPSDPSSDPDSPNPNPDTPATPDVPGPVGPSDPSGPAEPADPAGGRSSILREEPAPADTSRVFTVEAHGPEFIRIKGDDGVSYEFRWLDTGSIAVTFGYNAEMFRCGRESHTPVAHTKVYRWVGDRTDASADEEIDADYLKDLLAATDSSVSFGFEGSLSSASGDITLRAEDLFKLSSAPTQKSLFTCR